MAEFGNASVSTVTESALVLPVRSGFARVVRREQAETVVCAHCRRLIVAYGIEDADGVCLVGQLGDLGLGCPPERRHLVGGRQLPPVILDRKTRAMMPRAMFLYTPVSAIGSISRPVSSRTSRPITGRGRSSSGAWLAVAGRTTV
jgi:hypothetical protein